MASRLIMRMLPASSDNNESLKAVFTEMQGSREEQCLANRAVMGVTREYVCLQHTPFGDVLITYLEADDPDKIVERMMASDSEYARWRDAKVKPLIGTDLPAPEVLADWRAE